MALWVLLFIFLAGCSRTSHADKSEEGDLMDTLLYSDRYYDSDKRPLKNQSEAVSIRFQMILQHITVDDSTNLITVYCRMAMMWKDEFLIWKPEDYNGIKRLHFETHQIWKPSLSLYQNDATGGGSSEDYHYKCAGQFNGIITCIPHVTHIVLCALDARQWPYDVQNCTLRVGSWMNKDEQLNFAFAEEPIIYAEYQEHRQWTLIKHQAPTAWKKSGETLMYNEFFPSLNFNLLLKRKGSTYTTKIILPAICFTLLTISSAFMAPGNFQMGTAMTSLAAQLSYLIQIYGHVPSHGVYVPYVVMFFRDSVVMTTLTILVSMFMSALTKLKNQPPNFVYTVINLAKAGPVKIATFGEFDPDNVALSDAENSENLTKPEQQQSFNLDWKNFATIFTKFFFYTISFVYILLICIYVFA